MISIATGDVIAGSIPARALRLVQEWCELHRDELRLNCARRARGYFARVQLDPELGTISWPNGADVDPETLHLWLARGRGNVSA